jgi:hypothetical protein
MGTEFEDQDLSDAVFWGVDLSRATFRDVNFTGATMKGVWLREVEIDGLVDRLVVNGVDVTEYVDANDPWQPLRGMLRPTDGAGLLATWDELEREWGITINDVRGLPSDRWSESVAGEWSFVDTLRHLVFGIDKWFTAPLAGGSFDPIGLPNSGSAEFPWPGLDRSATPTFDGVVAVRSDRSARFRAYLTGFTEAEVTRQVEVLENGTVPAIECVYTVFEEAFEHLRYARRDLALLR